MKLTEKLQNLRKENNLSQEKLAELVGVSRQSVSKWEIGLSKPDTNNLMHLADVYNISLDELIGAAEPAKQLHGHNVKPIYTQNGFAKLYNQLCSDHRLFLSPCF